VVRRCVWSRNIKNRRSIYIYIYIYDISNLRVNLMRLSIISGLLPLQTYVRARIIHPIYIIVNDPRARSRKDSILNLSVLCCTNDIDTREPLPLYCHSTTAPSPIHTFLLLLASEYNQALNHHKQFLSLFVLQWTW